MRYFSKSFALKLQFPSGGPRRRALSSHRKSFKQMRLILVPGGGVEPPRAEAWRILRAW